MTYCTKKATVIFVMKQDGKYLFQKRENTGTQDGWYMMPGGHVDEGEKVLDAAVRELKEELNIIVQPKDLEFKLVKPEKSHICFFFGIKKYEGTITNNEPEKHSDLIFLTPGDNRIFPGILDEIQAIETGRAFLEM